MARSIALVVSVRINRSDRSLTAACGFRKSIWHRDAQGVSLFAVRPHIWSPWGFTHPEQKQSQEIKEGRHYFSLLRSLIQTAAGGPLSHSGCCEWMKGMDGRAGSSITAAAAYISIRRQTMWEAMCPRMQMPLTGRDGLCDGEQELHADWAGCDRPGQRLIVSVISRTRREKDAEKRHDTPSIATLIF